MTAAGRDAPAGTAAQARRLLARRGGWIESGLAGYALRVGRDGRTRILLAVDETVFRQLAEEPGRKTRPGGGWVARAGATIAVTAPEAGRPGVIEGVRARAEGDGRITTRRANLGQSAIACIRSSALQAAERDLGLGRRSGRALLKTGLAALAAQYGIS